MGAVRGGRRRGPHFRGGLPVGAGREVDQQRQGAGPDTRRQHFDLSHLKVSTYVPAYNVVGWRHLLSAEMIEVRLCRCLSELS